MKTEAVYFNGSIDDQILYNALVKLARHYNRPVSWVLKEAVREYFTQLDNEGRDAK